MHQEVAISRNDPIPALADPLPDSATVAELTLWFTRFRIAMATGIRHEVPWEQLPMAQVEILQLLVHQPRSRLSEIAQRQRLAVNTVSTLVKELHNKGYVRRLPDPRDGRAHLLEPTPAGEKALTEWLAVNEEFLTTAFDTLPPETVAVLQDALPALDELVHAMEDSASGLPSKAT